MKEKMKTWFSKKSNWVFLIILSFVLFQQVTFKLLSSKVEGRKLPAREYAQINNSESPVIFPPANGTALAIFWATWCGPCKLEMSRLNESMKNKKIPAGKIFAINPFDSEIEQRKFQAEKNYPFIYISDKELGNELGIQATPTTLLVKDGVIESLSTGLSIFGIWKAEFFLHH